MLNDYAACWKEVFAWVEATKMVHTLAYNRMGCIGHKNLEVRGVAENAVIKIV